MTTNEDEKVFSLLEQAVNKAQKSLVETKYFQPFLLLLNDSNEVEIVENDIDDPAESYRALEQALIIRALQKDIDVMVLVVDTPIPEKFVKDATSSIRLHLEERSQIHNKIGARFLYVPYELCKIDDSDMFVKLHTPIPVGFPAEYIVK